MRYRRIILPVAYGFPKFCMICLLWTIGILDSVGCRIASRTTKMRAKTPPIDFRQHGGWIHYYSGALDRNPTRQLTKTAAEAVACWFIIAPQILANTKNEAFTGANFRRCSYIGDALPPTPHSNSPALRLFICRSA